MGLALAYGSTGFFVAGAGFEPDGGADEAEGGVDLVGGKTQLLRPVVQAPGWQILQLQ